MTSKLAQMQARFQQRQMQEREEKLLKLYESQQQRAFDRVSRGSAGSNTSIGSIGGGKVRQMFDDRRHKAGIDKSYPLEPLKLKTNQRGSSLDRRNTTVRTVLKTTVSNNISSERNSKPIVNRREVVQSVYNNNDGDESYEEHRYEDVGETPESNSHREIINMMNNHNLNDSLDNEQMPQIGLDEVDEPRPKEKLSKTAVKMPNNVMVKKLEQKNFMVKSTPPTTTKIKENNTIVKKTARTAAPAKLVSSPRTSTPTTPSKTPTMQSRAKPTASPRAPSANRPSSKQTVHSPVARDDLTECNYCGRRFATDRIQKHEDICSKTGKKKRKAYDATKHRVTGTELETYVMRGPKGKSSHTVSKTTSKQGQKKDWRKTHEEFIAAIRAAKEAQAHIAKGGKLSDLPPPPPSSNPDYVQCPHCGRRFNESAAERHIPKCASFQFNKPKGGAPPPKGKPTRR